MVGFGEMYTLELGQLATTDGCYPQQSGSLDMQPEHSVLQDLINITQ